MTSRFPHGFRHGLELFNIPIMMMQQGPTIWVNSNGGANGNKGTRDRPFATLQGAIDKFDTENYDNSGAMIILDYNHAETITGAGGITCDVAGLTILGLGHWNQRPRFLMDGAATVTWLITAADVHVANVVLAAGHADVATGIGVTAVGAWLDGIEFVNNIVDENFVSEIKATGAANSADGLKVTRCRAKTVDASGAEFFELTDDIDGAVFEGNRVIKDAGTAAKFILCATGKDMTNVEVIDNVLITGATSGDTLIDNDTAVNSGVVAYNLVGSHDADAAVPIDLTGARCFENYQVGVDDASALLLPAVDDNS